MNILKRIMFAKVLFVGTIILLAGVGTTIGQKSPQEVRIINTTAQPVPTQAQGTTTVDGTVSLAPGSSVGISGTPTVNLPAGTVVGIDPQNNIVQIGNTPANPLIVRSVGDPFQPFQATIQVQINEGEFSKQISLIVPQGKLLIIEHVSTLVGIPSSQSVTQFLLNSTAGEQFAAHFLEVKSQPNLIEVVNRFVASQMVRVYADPGSVVRVTMSRNGNTGIGQFSASISGYLVDVPARPQ